MGAGGALVEGVLSGWNSIAEFTTLGKAEVARSERRCGTNSEESENSQIRPLIKEVRHKIMEFMLI